MESKLRKLAIGLGISCVGLLAVAAIIPSLIPSSIYKDKIQSQLSKELGRNVDIDGDVKISVFPTIRAKTDRVVIHNPDGFDGPAFASMEGLNAKLKLFPLLSKRVEISAFILQAPQINLMKKEDGSSNWVVGETTEKPSTSEEDAGPFKRDGRYSNLDPAIGLFSIENGAITYSDAQTDTFYALNDVNIAVSIPNFNEAVKIDGNLVLDETPLDLTLGLDSPRKFLNGEKAPVTAKIATETARIILDGHFLSTENIAFDVSIDSNISDMSTLSQYIPTGIPIASIAKSVNLDGNYRYDGHILAAKDVSIAAQGPALNASYSGDITLAEQPVLSGSVKMDVTDIPMLAGLLEQKIAGVDAVKALSFSADLSAEGTGFSASNIDANLTGDDLNAEFFGKAAFSDSVSAEGEFTGNATSIPTLVKRMQLDIPQANALGNATAAGRLKMSGNKIELDFTSATTTGDTLNANYKGKVTKSGDTINLNGKFDAEVPSTERLVTAVGVSSPYAKAVGKITASGVVSGDVAAITVREIDAQLSDGEINGRYSGSASLEDGVNLQGNLETQIKSLRKLATLGGTTLPPSTDVGAIYEGLTVSGTVKGSPSDMSFQNAALTLDHLKGQGQFNVDLKGAKPFVTGRLDMEGLDLRPYMASYAAQNPTGEIKPWSEEPLNLTMLRDFDANFDITTPSIITDRMEMGSAQVDAKLRNGVLTAYVPRLNLYGGLGKVTAVLNTQNDIPSIAFDLDMNNLKTNKFLAAVAGFTKASGDTKTGMSIKGAGRSQAAIMKSLSGQGEFKVEDGQISGVDLEQLLSGLDTALASRTLPSGLGSDYITKFNTITGLFTVKDGVVGIDTFDLAALGAAAKGGGQIDLGNQKIDFNLQPRLTGENASDLAGFGVPIRIKGGFGNVSAGLDTEMLGRIAAAKAQASLQKELEKKVGGSAGAILGGILGGGQATPGTTPKEATPSESQQAPTTEEVVSDLFGGLFGNPKTSEDKDSKKKE